MNSSIYKQKCDKDYYYLNFYCYKKKTLHEKNLCTLPLLTKPNENTLKLPQEIVQAFNFLNYEIHLNNLLKGLSYSNGIQIFFLIV